MNKRNRKYLFGFFLRKDFINGTFDGAEYVTNGNIKDGKMKIYLCYGNGWHETEVDAKTSQIARTVQDRYGKSITEKNARYKDTFASINDKLLENGKQAAQVAKSIGLKPSKPYNGMYKDSNYRVLVACRHERSMI